MRGAAPVSGQAAAAAAVTVTFSRPVEARSALRPENYALDNGGRVPESAAGPERPHRAPDDHAARAGDAVHADRERRSQRSRSEDDPADGVPCLVPGLALAFLRLKNTF